MKIKPKQVELDAFQWTGEPMSSHHLYKWLTETCQFTHDELNWHGSELFRVIVVPVGDYDTLYVHTTTNGAEELSPGDWLIKGVDGDIFPRKKYFVDRMFDIVEG